MVISVEPEWKETVLTMCAILST